jgi:hypothetical protein
MIIHKNKNMHIRIGLCLVTISLLAASCNPFAKTNQGGIAKTTNGGVDWQFVNALVRDTGDEGSLSGANIGTILFSPQKKQRMFAASYNGGLLMSDNSGEQWKQILSNVNVYDVMVDPTAQDTIYAAGLAADHGRVLITTDAGKSWQDIFTESSDQNPVRKITHNPKNSKELLIGLQSGTVIRSPDGGTNWQHLFSFDNRIQDIIWHLDGTLFVLLRDRGLAISDDGGLTFSFATDSLSGDAPTGNLAELVNSFIQVAVSSRDSNLVYVTTDRGLFKFTGETWRKLQVPARQEIGLRAIALSPVSDNTVYISSGATIYKSIDGGMSFQTNSIATSGFINYIVVDPELSQVAFAGIVVQ